VIQYKRGHRSIDRQITSDCNECRQTDKTGKRTNNKKNEQCGSNPPKRVPQANSHSTWALASQGGYLWQFANCEQSYASAAAAPDGSGRARRRRRRPAAKAAASGEGGGRGSICGARESVVFTKGSRGGGSGSGVRGGGGGHQRRSARGASCGGTAGRPRPSALADLTVAKPCLVYHCDDK